MHSFRTAHQFRTPFIRHPDSSFPKSMFSVAICIKSLNGFAIFRRFYDRIRRWYFQTSFSYVSFPICGLLFQSRHNQPETEKAPPLQLSLIYKRSCFVVSYFFSIPDFAFCLSGRRLLGIHHDKTLIMHMIFRKRGILFFSTTQTLIVRNQCVPVRQVRVTNFQ